HIHRIPTASHTVTRVQTNRNEMAIWVYSQLFYPVACAYLMMAFPTRKVPFYSVRTRVSRAIPSDPTTVDEADGPAQRRDHSVVPREWDPLEISVEAALLYLLIQKIKYPQLLLHRVKPQQLPRCHGSIDGDRACKSMRGGSQVYPGVH